MKHQIFFSLILLCASALVGRAQVKMQHYCLDVKDFVELKVTDGINVDYQCNPDSAGMAVFDAPAENAPQIIFEPSDSKLTIQLASNDNGSVPHKNIPTVKVYSRYLSQVENAGDSLVRVLSVAPGPKFKAKLIGNGRLAVHGINVNEASVSLATGNGSIVVTGQCENAKISLTGTGSITADELKAKTVSVRLGGTGTVGCNASEELSVKGVGSGKVYYVGTPQLKNKTLGISVQPLK